MHGQLLIRSSCHEDSRRRLLHSFMTKRLVCVRARGSASRSLVLQLICSIHMLLGGSSMLFSRQQLYGMIDCTRRALSRHRRSHGLRASLPQRLVSHLLLLILLRSASRRLLQLLELLRRHHQGRIDSRRWHVGHILLLMSQ